MYIFVLIGYNINGGNIWKKSNLKVNIENDVVTVFIMVFVYLIYENATLLKMKKSHLNGFSYAIFLINERRLLCSTLSKFFH